MSRLNEKSSGGKRNGGMSIGEKFDFSVFWEKMKKCSDQTCKEANETKTLKGLRFIERNN